MYDEKLSMYYFTESYSFPSVFLAFVAGGVFVIIYPSELSKDTGYTLTGYRIACSYSKLDG